MIIDAHHHFWTKAQYEAIYKAYGSPASLQTLVRDYSPQDLRPVLAAMGVDRTVLIQIEATYAHNRELLAIADAHEFVGAVIGWVDLEDILLQDYLDRLAEHERFRGVRNPLELKPTSDWILKSSVLRGLRLLAERQLIFELLMGSDHWNILRQLANSVPNLTLVINHFGKPDDTKFDIWSRTLRQLAPLPRVFVKLSGFMVLFPQSRWRDWTVELVKPYVDQLLETLGPERLMMGTDWPVSTVIGPYVQVLNAIKDCIADLSKDEQTQILGENARRLYAIQ